MKSQKDHYFKIGINGLMVACGAIFLYYVLFYSDKLSAVFSSFIAVLTPFITGIAIAYILNPIMVFIEDNIIIRIITKINSKYITNKKLRKIIRFITVFLCIAIFIAFLYGLIMMIVPQLLLNIQTLVFRAPMYFNNLSKYYYDFIERNPKFKELFSDSMIDMTDWVKSIVMPTITSWLSHTSSLFSSIVIVFKSVINFILGIIIAIYLLIDKEKFLAQIKKVIYAMYKESKANNYLNNLRYSNKIFSGFVTGKVIDSIIIGFLSYFGCLVLKVPYPLLVSVIVGVTNVIPYFGPFLGTIPSSIIVFMISPQKCIIFIIFIIVLQQFDGNVLGPKILGDSVGLSSFWVIFSITVFSKAFGLIGMFIGVPLFAVIYSAFRTFINQKLAAKNMPTDTNYYIVDDIKDNLDIQQDYSGSTFKFTRNFKEKSRFDRFTSLFSGTNDDDVEDIQSESNNGIEEDPAKETNEENVTVTYK